MKEQHPTIPGAYVALIEQINAKRTDQRYQRETGIVFEDGGWITVMAYPSAGKLLVTGAYITPDRIEIMNTLACEQSDWLAGRTTTDREAA